MDLIVEALEVHGDADVPVEAPPSTSTKAIPTVEVPSSTEAPAEAQPKARTTEKV